MIKNALFVHFPIENEQIESLSLPRHFAKKGINTYVTFHKGNRHYDYKLDVNGNVINVNNAETFSLEFDILIAKSSSKQSYDARYFKNSKYKINITPMGMQCNKEGYDYAYEDNQLTKPPVPSMFNKLMSEYDIGKKENIIIVPASLGTDKNQLELLNLVDAHLVKDWKIIFCGKSESVSYTNKMKNVALSKNINIEIHNFLNKEELANLILKSKLLALTTDPRPAQPYDPGPRVIPEGLCGGTPFFINDLVLVEDSVKSFGTIYRQGNAADMNDKLKDAMFTWNQKSLDVINFAKVHYNMENACECVYSNVIQQIENERKSKVSC